MTDKNPYGTKGANSLCFGTIPSNPIQLETPLVLIDRNNRNSSELTCTGSGDKKCTILEEFKFKSKD